MLHLRATGLAMLALCACTRGKHLQYKSKTRPASDYSRNRRPTAFSAVGPLPAQVIRTFPESSLVIADQFQSQVSSMSTPRRAPACGVYESTLRARRVPGRCRVSPAPPAPPVCRACGCGRPRVVYRALLVLRARCRAGRPARRPAPWRGGARPRRGPVGSGVALRACELCVRVRSHARTRHTAHSVCTPRFVDKKKSKVEHGLKSSTSAAPDLSQT